MSFIISYKHPLCFLIFVYSMSKILSEEDLNLYDLSSIQKFITSNNINSGSGENGETKRTCNATNLLKRVNNRANIIATKDDKNQFCIKYDNEDDSNYIRNPEVRYPGKELLDLKIKEWIQEMQNEQMQFDKNKYECDSYTGDNCIYIKGTELKLPMRSLTGHCDSEHGQAVKWFENTNIKCFDDDNKTTLTTLCQEGITIGNVHLSLQKVEDANNIIVTINVNLEGKITKGDINCTKIENQKELKINVNFFIDNSN